MRSTGSPRTAGQITFNGIVSGSVQLSVVGAGSTTLTGATSTLAPTPARGTINFGSFSTLTPSTVANGTGYRISSAPTGAVIAAHLIATLVYNGAATGTMTVARQVLAGAAPDVPLANLRLASPSLGTWTAGSNGVQVPNAGAAGYDICRAAGDATCINGKTYDHQLAVFVPDTQVAGTFSTVVVYTGTSP